MGIAKVAQVGHVMHVYDFRVKPGTGDKFINEFDVFDVSDENLMHKSSAQIKDGVLCRDTTDADHFYLIGEWASVEAHRAILTAMREGDPPPFLQYVEGDGFLPVYAEVVAPTY